MIMRIRSVLTLCAAFVVSHAESASLGTAFNYEGSLAVNGSPANGIYDFSFALFEAESGGGQLSPVATRLGVQTVAGAFTTTLDFGNIFNGAAVWLELGVRTNGSTAAFVVLAPRQLITAVPYAQYALIASTASQVGSNTVGALSIQNGAVGPAAIANGAVVRSVNGLTDQVTLSAGANITLTPAGNSLQISASGGGGGSGGWVLTGNAGTTSGDFLGTLDNRPLELWVNASRALRLEPTTAAGTVNVVGGSAGNYVAPGIYGATIGGGGSLNYFGTPTNSIAAGMSTIGGGDGNSILPNAYESTIAGGNQNSVLNGSFRSTIGGGFQNVTGGQTATVAGGTGNAATGNGAFVGGGGYDGTTYAGNTSAGVASLVGGGLGNRSTGDYATVAGGYYNLGSDFYAAVGGGYENYSTSIGATVAGGYDNMSSGYAASVGGGFTCAARGDYATVPGGENNNANGAGSFAAGRKATALHNGAFVWNDGVSSFTSSASNQFLIHAAGGVGINTASPSQALDVNGQFMVVDGLGGEQAYLGGDGVGGDVQVGSLNPNVSAVAFWNATSSAYMHVYCSSLTIEGGADLAEPFQLAPQAEEIPTGAVVVIDDQNAGRLKISDRPYDTRVAGVLSGAQGINPGIQMQQQGLVEGGKNVALAGRVYVLADAGYGAIKPGDQLTTSATPGHAMRVTEHTHAQGAILGKAMSPLSKGKGMVLVLVTLQ